MSQNQRILNHLKAGKTLTPLEALGLYDCLRLAARVEELRDQLRVEKSAYKIHTDMVKQGGKRFGRYRLVK